jgi:hypothetical protein
MSITPLNRLLVKAIKNKDVARVAMLLKIGANPNYVFKEKGRRSRLLKESVHLGNLEISELLKEYHNKMNNS